MSSIRNEYNEFKQQASQDPIYEELETDGDLVLITERLNRSTVNRLNNSITRFDKKFSPYNEKLPAIAEIIKAAEDGLYLVLTGKMGSRNASKMLERMGIIHNILSDFFGRDLAMLLKMPYFKAAKLTPDIKLNELAVDDHNVKVIRRTFASALKPSELERKLFRKVFRNFEMPTLNWNEAAKQLVSLTFNELSDLSDIERIPMIVADLKDKQEEEISGGAPEESFLDEVGLEERGGGYGQQASNAGGKLLGGIGKVAGTAAKGAAVATGLGVAATALTGKALYNRFKGPSPEDIKEMNLYFDRIRAVIPKLTATQSMLSGLSDLEKNIKKAESGAKFSGWNPLRNPAQLAIAQGKQLIDMFEKLGSVWVSAGAKYDTTPVDTEGLRKLFSTQINTIGSKAGRLFKVNLPKGLDVKSVIDALVAVAAETSGGAEGESPATDVANEKPKTPLSENRLTYLFNSVPKRITLSENLQYQFNLLEEFEAYVEAQSGALLLEDFAALDDMLRKFSSIKTGVDERLEQGGAAPSQAAKPDGKQKGGTEQRPPVVLPGAAIDTCVANSKTKYSEEENRTMTEAIRKLAINTGGADKIDSIGTGAAFLGKYKDLLSKESEMKELKTILDTPPVAGVAPADTDAKIASYKVLGITNMETLKSYKLLFDNLDKINQLIEILKVPPATVEQATTPAPQAAPAATK